MAQGMAIPPSDFGLLGRESVATFLYGSSRTVVLRLAYALARVNDPRPFWVDVRDANDYLDPPGPVELGWVPDDHLFVVSRSEAKPQDAVSNLALWTVVRSDEPRSVIGGLTDFLRLPPSIQDVLGRYGGDESHPIFVVANTDRVREYYPRNVSGVRGVIDAMLHGGVTPIFATQGPPGPGRFAFDLVLDVQVKDLAHWADGQLHCERGANNSPVHEGQTIPLASIPAVAASMQGHPAAAAAPG